MLNKYENSLDTSDCLGNTQQDKILEQEKDTVTPTEHEEIYENDVTPPTGNHIINTVADLLLQPNAVYLQEVVEETVTSWMMMKEKGKIVNILEVEEDDKERNRGAALLSIYNEFKDEIKAIRTDIQHLNIQQPQQSENNQELNSLLKETIVNAVNDTINAHINSRENYADEVSRRCKNTIDFAIERETKLVNNVVFPKLSPIIQIDKKVDAINERLNGIENDIQKIPKNNIDNANNHRFLCIMLIIITCIFWVLGNFLYMDLNQRYNELKESHEIVMRNISSDKIKK